MGLKESGLRGSLRSVSAGVPAIPDSAVNQHPLDEGSGTTINDSIGNLEGTLGDTDAWISDSTYEGGNALDFSNVGSGGSVAFGELPSIIDPTRSEPWGFAITISAESTIDTHNDDVTWVNGSDDGSDDIRFFVCGDDLGDDEFMMDCIARDVNDRDPQVVDKDDFDYTKPDQFRAFMIIEGTGIEDVTVYIDDSELTLDDAAGSNAGTYSSFADDDLHYGSRADGGDTVEDGIIDNPIIYDDPSRGDVTKDFDIQPWS